MPLKFKVSFDAPKVGATGRYSETERIERSNEMTAKEAADDVRLLKSYGYRGIKVVPVRPSARARGHSRRVHTAEFDATVAAIEASEIEAGRSGNPYAIATA